MLEKNLSELFVTRVAMFLSYSQRRREGSIGRKKTIFFHSEDNAEALMGSMCSSDSAAADTLASAPLLTGSDAERQASSSSAKVVGVAVVVGATVVVVGATVVVVVVGATFIVVGAAVAGWPEPTPQASRNRSNRSCSMLSTSHSPELIILHV